MWREEYSSSYFVATDFAAPHHMSYDAALRDALIEECALGMGHRSNYAAARMPKPSRKRRSVHWTWSNGRPIQQ
jgi:hypothetical protein